MVGMNLGIQGNFLDSWKVFTQRSSDIRQHSSYLIYSIYKKVKYIELIYHPFQQKLKDVIIMRYLVLGSRGSVVF
jgi:hypothetical protein